MQEFGQLNDANKYKKKEDKQTDKAEEIFAFVHAQKLAIDEATIKMADIFSAHVRKLYLLSDKAAQLEKMAKL